MTNIEKLTALYEKKIANGLKDVKFHFRPDAKWLTAEELAGEILKMERAIKRGEYTIVNFADGIVEN